MSSTEKVNIVDKHVSKKMGEARKLVDRGIYPQAIVVLKEIIDSNPELSDAFYLIGYSYINQGSYSDGAAYLLKAIELNSEEAQYHSILGFAYVKISRIDLAIKSYKSSLALDGDNTLALTGLGDLYHQRGQLTLAHELYAHAVEVKPSMTNAQIMLARVLSDLGEYEKAVEHAKKAVRQTPNDSNTVGMYARIHLIGGNIEEAKKLFLKSINLNNKNGISFSEYVSIQKITDKDDPIIKAMEKTLKSGMPARDRMTMHFALGKAYNNCKQWDKAFENFDKGNRLYPGEYNTKIELRFLKEIKKLFTASFINQYAKLSNCSESPIFIIGMPRSGSTLIDQVLSSHSKVYSVGESRALTDVIESLSANSGIKSFPQNVVNITQEIIDASSKKYFEITREDAGDAVRIVNKMLFTHFYLGFVAMLFPNAKIINCNRNPLDNCLSIFFTDLEINSAADEWSSSLKTIGFRYKQYNKLMQYWKKTLNLQILDVQYENMVENLEENARQIIKHCGLEWEPQCLEFYKSKRSVQTASVSQVRRPIYKTSVSRWVPYAKHLTPLVEELGDLVEGDYEQLRELGCNFKVKNKGMFKRFF